MGSYAPIGTCGQLHVFTYGQSDGHRSRSKTNICLKTWLFESVYLRGGALEDIAENSKTAVLSTLFIRIFTSRLPT